LLCFGAINKLTDPAAFVQKDNMTYAGYHTTLVDVTETGRLSQGAGPKYGGRPGAFTKQVISRIKTNVSVKYASLKKLKEKLNCKNVRFLLS
jgi:hypothetical protein